MVKVLLELTFWNYQLLSLFSYRTNSFSASFNVPKLLSTYDLPVYARRWGPGGGDACE